MSVLFQCNGVKKSYVQRTGLFGKKKVPVLDGISLELHGQCVNAVTGPSGAGKSTLSRLLMKLEDWDEGDILLQGTSIRAIPKKDYYQKNRIMFQNPYSAVNPSFTIEKIIAEPLKIAGIDDHGLRQRIQELLDLVGLPESLLRRFPHQVSGGQLQRVVLARTLSTTPAFIVLDEPFSSLDDILANRLARDFKKIFRQLDISVLFISHHNQRVNSFADHTVRIAKGKIRC